MNLSPFNLPQVAEANTPRPTDVTNQYMLYHTVLKGAYTDRSDPACQPCLVHLADFGINCILSVRGYIASIFILAD